MKVSSVGIKNVVTIVQRILAGLFAFGWLTIPGFGLADLSSTWDPNWPQVLEGGWGLYLTVFVSVPFIVIAVGRRVSRMPAVAQLYVAAAGLTIAAVPALEWQLAVLSLVIAAQIMIVAGLPSRRGLGRPNHLTQQPLMILAALGAVPWLTYAITMWDLNRQERGDTDITIGIDHYSMQGAYAVTSLALVSFAAASPAARLLMSASTGLAAVYLGLVSWVWHPTQGSMNQAWSALCMLWGAAVVVLGIATRQHRPGAK